MAREEITEKTIYLRRGILALIAWAVFACYMFDELKDIDGVFYNVNSVKEGSYKPIIIVTLSVVIFAYALRNIVFYFKTNAFNEKNHTLQVVQVRGHQNRYAVSRHHLTPTLGRELLSPFLEMVC